MCRNVMLAIRLVQAEKVGENQQVETLDLQNTARKLEMDKAALTARVEAAAEELTETCDVGRLEVEELKQEVADIAQRLQAKAESGEKMENTSCEHPGKR